MTTTYGQLGPKDGPEQMKRLVNQMRRNLPGPALLRIPLGPVDLLTTGQTLAIPANAEGWASEFIDIIPVTITGAQTGAPIVRLGSNATFDNVAPLTNLGTALVADEIVPVTLTAPVTLQSDPVYFDVQTAGTGPTVLTVMVYVAGYFAR